MTALAVSRLSAPGLYFVGEVPGLALQVLETGGRTWVLRVTIGGKRRDMGLGGYPAVTLAGAREAARAARLKVRQGVDPIEEARASKSALRAARASALSFDECAAKYIKANAAKWKNAKSGQQWRNTLETYAGPVMGNLLVRDVGMSHVLAVLEPIWRTKTETASRLRGRIEAVLDWATACGYRDGLNPARWKGHLAKVLPAANEVRGKDHHPALPIDEMGGFMLRLRQSEGMGARALEFAILTAARSGEVRGAVWAEFDFDEAVWNVPAERMKGRKPHRVPLSPTAVTLLKSLPKRTDSPYVFAGRGAGTLSDMTLLSVVRRLDVPVVPHGFRSTFRDWAAERTNYPNHVAEMALAHTIGDKVEAAYRRGDLFQKRVRMMTDWAKFCGKVEQKGVVVPMNPKERRKTAA
ncbi:MAG TPA: integrase arm-type DNA-binding domain-containing protein [Burkholderiaceae bacterium]